MKYFCFLSCLLILIGCSTANQKGILQPNKTQTVNTHFSKMVPKVYVTDEPTKIPDGLTVSVNTNIVKSHDIDTKPKTQPITKGSYVPPSVKTTPIIEIKKPDKEIERPQRESFSSRLTRYCIVWFSFLAVIGIIIAVFRRTKMSKDNPFKENKKQPKQLELKL